MNMKTRRLPWVRATTTLVCLAAAGLAQAQFRISTEGCRYSPAEIEAALGFATQDGRGGEVRIGASRQLSCNYLGKGSAHSLVLSQVLVEGGVVRGVESGRRGLDPATVTPVVFTRGRCNPQLDLVVGMSSFELAGKCGEPAVK